MTIDWWTLAIQTVNVIILVALLGRFFFRPVATMVADRQAEIASGLAAAKTAREAAETTRAEREKALAGVAAERSRLLAEATREADTQKAALVAAANAETAKLRAEAEAGIARERAAAERAVAEHAATLAVSMAERLVARLPAEQITPAFLADLVNALDALPADRRAVASAELVSAAPLAGADAAAAQAAVAKSIGVTPTLRTDPALIAGFELHAPGLMVTNSWRADLAQLAAKAHG
ncbi:F0F1 ATP synthase subunit B [Acuticoccus kandeliae]|uniref:F0F1 ATP synthase subunit B n=1 Tax=Acuticoccus kandeliae TaxID=2073160 RepID=UPI0013007919|nr:F0F1 ATP synthase subunit B [Acuticoccus kandeliae]